MNIIDQLKRDEGVKLSPYRDSVGRLTIGIGRNLDDVGLSAAEIEYLLKNDASRPPECVSKPYDGLVLAVSEAEYLCMGDLARTQERLYETLPWVEEMDPVRRSVLLNMSFNMGVGGLLKFSNSLHYIRQSLWNAAAAEMERSLWAKQVGDRALRLAKQLVTGEWQ